MDIIKYKDFLFEQDDADIDKSDSTVDELIRNRLNDFNKDLNYYKSNKSKVDSLIKNNKDNKDISEQLKKIVNKNSFLIKYAELVNLEQSLTEIENKIDSTNETIKDKQTNGMRTAQQLTDVAERTVEIKSINDRISELKAKNIEYNKKIQEISKKVQDKKKALDIFIKDTKLKLDKDIQNLNNKK